MFILHSSDPCQTAYYYPIILIIIIILLILEFLTTCLKNKYDDINSSFNNTLQQGVSYSATFIKRKNTLKLRYLIGYVLTRAAVWSKAPYLYTLYSTIHGFSMSEIGVLYIIDAVSATIGGPITGNLADIYGRRLFCQIYNILVIANLLLRMTGNKPLAYAAQILTGIGGGLINTTFESWVVFEANKEFTTSRNIEKDRFLKKLFKTQNILDAVMSIVISAICAIAYVLLLFNLTEFMGNIRTSDNLDYIFNRSNDNFSNFMGGE
jgi:MFS family permease